MSKNKISLFMLLLASSFSYGQTPSGQILAEEGDLRACLLLEQEGLERFRALEQKSNDLRASEKLMNDRRTELANQKPKVDPTNSNKEAIGKFNEAVSAFNQQADQFNAGKDAFDKESGNYDSWVKSTLKPACDKVINKPVNPVTSYYACGFDSKQPLTEVPHCKSLPNPETLKNCIQKAGSKNKAFESCTPKS